MCEYFNVHSSFSKKFAIKFAPFLEIDDKIPESSLKDLFFRCHGCGAFFNKFNDIEKDYEYKCSVCGSINFCNNFSSNFKQDPMFNNNIYELTNLPKNFTVRPKFIPTDFLFISQSLFQNPLLLNYLSNILQFNVNYKK